MIKRESEMNWSDLTLEDKMKVVCEVFDGDAKASGFPEDTDWAADFVKLLPSFPFVIYRGATKNIMIARVSESLVIDGREIGGPLNSGIGDAAEIARQEAAMPTEGYYPVTHEMLQADVDARRAAAQPEA